MSSLSSPFSAENDEELVDTHFASVVSKVFGLVKNTSRLHANKHFKVCVYWMMVCVCVSRRSVAQ